MVIDMVKIRDESSFQTQTRKILMSWVHKRDEKVVTIYHWWKNHSRIS